MEGSEALAGQMRGPARTPSAAKSAPAFPQSSLINVFHHRGVNARGLMPGLRCGGRMMVAARTASLGLSCGIAAFRFPTARIAAAAFSSHPSTIPKPGFAPGAPGASPPPPGTKPPGTDPLASSSSAAASGTGALSSARLPAPGVVGTRVSASAPFGGGSSDAVPDGFPTPPPAKGKGSKLGWAIPIIGLPLIAAYYNYQKEYDKAWDEKVQNLLKEFQAMRKQPPPRAVAQPPPPPPAMLAPSPPPNDGKDGAGAPAPAPAAAPPAAPKAVASEPTPAPPAPTPPAVAPAFAPALVPEAAPAAAVPSDAEAAGAILEATEAASAAAGSPAAATATTAPEATPAPAAAPPAPEKTAAAPAAPLASPPAPPQPPAPPAPSPEAAVAAATAAALALLQTNAVQTAPLPESLPLGKLGLEGKDLSPLGLIQHAVSSAGAQVVDWSQWPERHAQAVADSRAVFEALTAVAKWHEEQMTQVRGELAAAVQRSEQLQSAGEAAVRRFKDLLKQVVDSSKEMLELEVRQAEKRTRLESEKTRLAEATRRGTELEQLRLAIGALGLAHEARVRQAAAAQAGHVLAAGAAAVAAAAESGAPLGGAAAALRGLAAVDPLVGSVVEALPEGAVATRAELLQRFRRLRSDLSALSYLPDSRAGILAVAVARLAARLKVDESEAVKVLDPQQYGSGGVDAALARTEALLTAGQLTAAAELAAAALQGTAAAALADEWLAAVRQRAAAEASVAALNAHAAATWASLA